MAKMLEYGDKGPRVKQLQRLLNDNPHHRMKTRLVVDGEFGPLTAAAIQSTKYWTGYAKEDIQPVAADFLFGLLRSKNLPDDYAARRRARKEKQAKEHAAQTAMDKMRLRVLTIINGERGTIERPNNSNHIKYNDWWGWGAVPYCVIGLSWAWVKAGSKAFVKGSRWAGCREMLADAKAGGKGIHLTHDPDPGCPGVVDLNGDASPDHAITFVKDNGDGTCTTVEFNTQKNYIGGVWNSRRLLRSCWWFTVEK
jgi:hypothetical protein